jgi:hypothetical protein
MLRSRLTFANIVSFIALVFAVGGTSAYAANTVFSADIVDGEVKTADLGAASVTNAKLADNSVGTGKIIDGHISANDLGQGSVTSEKVVNNSLTGEDINESTLNLPSTAAGVTTNRIVTAVATPPNQALISLPGLGEVRFATCSAKSAATKFVNTTLGYVDVVTDANTAAGYPSPVHDRLGPNEQTQPAIEGTERSIYQVGLGLPGKVASVIVTAWPDRVTCTFQAMAIAK